MRHALILTASALLCFLFPDLRQTAGQETAQQEVADHTPTYKIAWTHKTADDGRDHLWQYLKFLPESQQLVAIEKSLDTSAMRDGRFMLWRFAADGKVIGTSRIDERPAEMLTGPSPGDILGVFPLANEELLVIGAVDDADSEIVFIQLDGQGKRLRSTALAKRFKHGVTSAVRKSDNSVLLLGASHPDALAVETDLDGNIIWEQTYQSKARFKTLQSAVIAPDGKTMLLVGKSGEWTKFGSGPTDVWLLHCDAQGKLLDQRTFPGHPICTTAFAGDKLALLRGEKSWLEYLMERGKPSQASRMIIGSDLKTLSDDEMDFIAWPAMAQTASDRFVLAGIAGGPEPSLNVREYNADGQVTRRLDRPWDRGQDGEVTWLRVTGDETQAVAAIQTLPLGGKRPVQHGILFGLTASEN